MREFITGAEAIGRAALDAGCDFFAGYPITPATPILLYMVKELPKVGGVAFQAEDELASIGMCIGAALSGARVLTATSGPGLSLYSENIGLAIMAEVPMVIVDCQRLGPATGAATTTGEGDVQFLRWGTSGGYPVIVLAPADAVDCYNLTRRAFYLSERFRLPVFVATDKETVATLSAVEMDRYLHEPVPKRNVAPADADHVPYRIGHPAEVPVMSPFGGPHLVRVSGASYNERGSRAWRPAELDRLNRHLAAKVDQAEDEIALVRADLQPGARTVVISYGISSGSVAEAVRLVRREGGEVSGLTVISLWPVPEQAIRDAIRDADRVVVVEMNLGQYRREIERLATDRQQVVGVNRVDGELISPDQILAEGGIL
jgi:2-oxoglutarate ferredoxin oxidoreductase subunit alpha